MDGDSNVGTTPTVDSANNSSKIDSSGKSLDSTSILNDNDVPMKENENTNNETTNMQNSHLETDKIDGNKEHMDSSLKQNSDIENNCTTITASTPMDEDLSNNATPGTSVNNKTSTAVRRPAGSKPKTNRFAKRNYRKQIASSSSSNRSTPELRNRSESTESSNLPNRDRGNNSVHDDNENEEDNDDDWEDEDDEDDEEDDDDDDDDDDDSSDYSFHNSPGSESDDSAQSKTKTNADQIKDAILKKEKPNYKRNLLTEIICREHGLSPNKVRSIQGRTALAFQERVYGARQTIERLGLLHNLQKHDGCVNSLNFNKSGTLLASGSDDLLIILWDWASKKIKYSVQSGHHSNVFQTKFVDFGDNSNDIHIVSSGRDGQVRYVTIPPGGCHPNDTRQRLLLKHAGSVHKISPSPHNPYEVLTAGEDGHVYRCDLRKNNAEKVCAVKTKKHKVPLFSIAHNPHEPHFCVCGRDQFVRVYDKRNAKAPLSSMCPDHLENKKSLNSHITCAVYNSSGSEILASYSDEDIYSFSTRFYTSGKYLHRYRGHNNNKTIKGVNYFGLNSEYVVSGSDCGNFFIWDRETEAILNWKKADHMGVVNCLEPHPTFPVLATSGLDHDIKVWAPINEKYPPALEGLEKCLRNNVRRMPSSNLFDDRTLYFFVRQCLRNRRSNVGNDCPIAEDFSTSDSDSDTNDCDGTDNLRLQSFPPCNPQ